MPALRLALRAPLGAWLSSLCIAAASLNAAHAQVPPPPAIAAKSWMLIDVTGNRVLAQNEVDTRVEPASLTKLMSAYVVFHALRSGVIKNTDVVPVSTKAWKAEGSRMFIEPNRPVTVDELLRGMIAQSGNDATIALAERVGGSEEQFVELMNRKAAEFGLKNTNFRNATGLPDPAHYTTARDLATIAQRLVSDFPEYLPLYSLREYTYNNIKQPNRNRLLWTDPTVDGLKTGHTDAAGWCLIATAKRPLAVPANAKPGERRVLSVVLGAVSDAARAQESQKLLNHAFLHYDDVRLFEANQALQTIGLYKGTKPQVKAGVARDVIVTVPRGAADKLKASVERSDRLIAPVKAGQVIGNVKLTLDGELAGELPLVALEDVDQASVFGRAYDTVRIWLGK
ncbi:MAG TPA: D-alanyl-D-alanine carboxypeptidase family protein [Burkholderiaceae bacterium]|nr:D-alanyl-D-alanine carboxypeptidase family protein [Burkholderiaceae bacterium]